MVLAQQEAVVGLLSAEVGRSALEFGIGCSRGFVAGLLEQYTFRRDGDWELWSLLLEMMSEVDEEYAEAVGTSLLCRATSTRVVVSCPSNSPWGVKKPSSLASEKAFLELQFPLA